MKQCVKKESSRLKCNTGASGPETTNSGDLREGSRNIRKSGFCGKKGIGSWHSGSFLSLFLFPNVSALQSAHQEHILKHVYARMPVLRSALDAPLLWPQVSPAALFDAIMCRDGQCRGGLLVHATYASQLADLPLKCPAKDVFVFKSVSFRCEIGLASWVTQDMSSNNESFSLGPRDAAVRSLPLFLCGTGGPWDQSVVLSLKPSPAHQWN